MKKSGKNKPTKKRQPLPKKTPAKKPKTSKVLDLSEEEPQFSSENEYMNYIGMKNELRSDIQENFDEPLYNLMGNSDNIISHHILQVNIITYRIIKPNLLIMYYIKEVKYMLSVDYYLVGNKIKEKRKKLGLTQENLAELCDLSVSYIAHIERGTKSLSLETAVKISNVLSVSLDYLLLDEIQDHERVFSALESEVNALSPAKRETFFKFSRLILKNIDEL